VDNLHFLTILTRLTSLGYHGGWRHRSGGRGEQDGDCVIPGLLDAYRALPLSEAGRLDWLTRPSRHLDGRTPIEALHAGETAAVLTLARSLGRA
jgi:hypothetical protein